MADLLPSVADVWTNVSDAISNIPTMVKLLPVPPKFIAVAGTAALGYYVDQKLLISSDVYHTGLQALALVQTKRHALNDILLPDLFEQSVDKWPHKSCMQFGRRVLSFQQVDEAANRVAHWGLQRGLQTGQTVALLMENRPEFIIVWLGLAKIGVVTALLNTHLQPDGLIHCTMIADTKWMIVGEELAEKLEKVADKLTHVNFLIYGDG